MFANKEKREGVLNPPGQWHFFLSHTQQDPAAKLMVTELWSGMFRYFNIGCWLDVKMQAKDMDAMKEGVINSDVFIAVATNNGTRQPDTSTVAAGECLPLRENRADVIAATIEAVGKATATMREFHSRQQLLVFGTTYDMDVAEYYVGLLLGEMGRHQPVMTVKQLTPKK